jgi:5-methylcytosine-specific restriction endonuclease McrBC GTP-binding regulatory subunit McrB
MTIEDFENFIESLKRKYLTIVRKIAPDNLWMAPNKADWYHSQYFVIDVKLNSDKEIEISFNVNDINVVDKRMRDILNNLKTHLKKENFTYDNIDDAKIKFQELSRQFPGVMEKKQDFVYSEIGGDINNIQDKLLKIDTTNLSQNRTDFNKIFNGLYLSNEIKASFYNGLKTKGFVILAGISGTGKTKIFEKFVKSFNKDNNSIFIPVRPDFKDSKSLLGFYNPLSDEYQSTRLLDLILEAKDDLKNPYFILFDEMNLARVEYYFSDFLSLFESIRDEKGFTKESLKLHNSDSETVKQQGIPKELKLPPNIYFVGSVNIDETTNMFSPKVLDRAFTIEFSVQNFQNYIKFLEENNENNDFINISTEFKRELKKDFINSGDYTSIIKDDEFIDVANRYYDDLQYLNDLLPNNLKFGYRIFDEVISFIYNSENSIFQFSDGNEAFDLAIKMKILPKFHGNRHKLDKVLDDILEFTQSNGLHFTTRKIYSMKENLQSFGYTSFM